ncbi:DUF4381 domain-containing protein [Haliea sp. E17]|uniref:DUF4381 domain-containing protein n=1 Tax=Haliea sp. E17 TaxID=3401576 RepID=UPI003AACDE71
MNAPSTNGGIDPLAALRPLREPEAIGWWPPAPGWWILAGLLVLALVLATRWWLRRRRREAYRVRALAALADIRATYAGNGDGLACLIASNELLKSVALRAFPRRDVAGMSGEAWLRFLNDSQGEESFDPALLVAQYRPTPPVQDVSRHLDASEQWIRKHRRPA